MCARCSTHTKFWKQLITQIYTRLPPKTATTADHTGRENASRKNTPKNSAHCSAMAYGAKHLQACTAWPPALTILKKKPRALAVQHAITLNENTEFMRPPGLPLRRIPAALQKGPQKASYKITPHCAEPVQYSSQHSASSIKNSS